MIRNQEPVIVQYVLEGGGTLSKLYELFRKHSINPRLHSYSELAAYILEREFQDVFSMCVWRADMQGNALEAWMTQVLSSYPGNLKTDVFDLFSEISKLNLFDVEMITVIGTSIVVHFHKQESDPDDLEYL